MKHSAPQLLGLQVRFAWWVKHYLTAVALGAALTGREPDLDKVLGLVMRGARIRVLELRGVMAA